jgi:drug/metabolite transporter (DMT)-like permease
MQLREWLLLLVLSLLWGGSFFFNKLALRDLLPLTVVWVRASLAALTLLGLVYLRGEQMPVARQQWQAFAMMGLLNNLIPFSLIVWGQRQIDSSLAATLNATTPLFTVLLAHWLTQDERLTPRRFAGVGLGFMGVVVLMGADLAGLNFHGHILGQAAVLAAALSYACAGLYGRRFKATSATVAAAGMLTSTAVLLLPAVLLIERPWQFHPGTTTLAALLGLGLLSTALAYQIYFHILAVAGATNLLLVTFLIPISATLLGSLFLQERLAGRTVVGMVLTWAGLLAIDGRLPRLLRFWGQRLTGH